MQKSAVLTPVRNPETYAEVWTRYQKYIYRMVQGIGIPRQEVPDAVSNIVVRMLERDGMADFEGEPSMTRMRVYVSSYFRLSAQAELERYLTWRTREFTQDPVMGEEFVKLIDSPINYQDYPIFEELPKLVDGDARHFLEVCREHDNYKAARQALADEGWESIRIRRAVTRARAAVRTHLCMK